MYFNDVNTIDLKSINWKILYDRNNQTYKMLVNICYLVINGLIHTEKSGKVKLMNFSDDQLMSSLYEKFLLNYFKKEHPYLLTHSPHIDWQIDDGMDSLLPKMKTDVTLEYENKILIIDAKFYKKILSNIMKRIYIIPIIYIKFLLMLKIKKVNLKKMILKFQECYFTL